MLVSFSFDCQDLFAANKLIHLQQTCSGDQGINDVAKSTCSKTARHPTGAVTLSNVLFLCTASILKDIIGCCSFDLRVLLWPPSLFG